MLDINRGSHRYAPIKLSDEDKIRAEIIKLAEKYGRYGYRKIADLMKNGGKVINYKRVERIWREEGLKVPQKQPKKGRLWLNDGSCVRLRPEYKNNVWSYDFIEDKTMNGKKIRWLNIIDEHSRECLASIPQRNWTHIQVIETLAALMLLHGLPAYIRSDNGPEFTAKKIRQWLEKLGVTTAFVEPGSPWENGYIESFNAIMRDQFLNGEIFYNMYEAQVLTAHWVHEYNYIRPHGSLGGKPPIAKAPKTIIPNKSHCLSA